MLSVAKCGYDNDYGDTNKSYHTAEDLQILKQHETLLDSTYPQDTFQALITNSMQNGANCINITSEKDIFYHEDSIISTINLISHEFGIYMLMTELANTPAFQDFTYFRLVEGLAEYYNTIVTGDSTNWEWADEYVEFYRQQGDNEPELTAEELFWRAADHFVVQP